MKTDNPLQLPGICFLGNFRHDSYAPIGGWGGLLVLVTLAVCALACLLCSCNDAEKQFASIHVEEISKIELLNKDVVEFSSTDSDKIRNFLFFLLTASWDTSGQDFKSWNYAKFYTENGKFYRVEMFGKFIRTNGVRFALDSEVLARFKTIFGLL
jgi:hypothetical protein